MTVQQTWIVQQAISENPCCLYARYDAISEHWNLPKIVIISNGVDITPSLRRLKYQLRLRKANLDWIKKAKPNRTTTTMLLPKISPWMGWNKNRPCLSEQQNSRDKRFDGKRKPYNCEPPLDRIMPPEAAAVWIDLMKSRYPVCASIAETTVCNEKPVCLYWPNLFLWLLIIVVLYVSA